MFWSTWVGLRILVFVHRGLPYFANVRYLEKKALWHRFEAGFRPVGSSKPTLFQNREYGKTTVQTINDVLSCWSNKPLQCWLVLIGEIGPCHNFSKSWRALSRFFNIVTCPVTFLSYWIANFIFYSIVSDYWFTGQLHSSRRRGTLKDKLIT